jgi:hypothetical protein
MPYYQYGEIFDHLGVPNMGRQGSGWCGEDADGVLVLMAHQNFFHRGPDGKYYYDAPGDPRLPTSSPSAARNIRMIGAYFEPGKPILLPVGEFSSDGGFDANGEPYAAEFKRATGAVYRATFRTFDANTGRIVCDVVSKFEV